MPSLSSTATTRDRRSPKLRPDIWVKGGDYGGTELPEAAAVEAAGGRVVLLPYLSGRSTTSIIERSRCNPNIQRERNHDITTMTTTNRATAGEHTGGARAQSAPSTSPAAPAVWAPRSSLLLPGPAAHPP